MIPSIDFLPADYRQRRQRRRKRLWWRCGFLVVLVLLGLCTVRQHQRLSQQTADRDRLQDQLRQMSAALHQAETLPQQRRQLEQQADVITLLRLQTRATPVLAAVAEALPPFVTLTDFDLVSETSGPSRSGGRPPSGAPDKAAAGDQTPAARDLKRLREHRAQTALSLSLSGIAPHDVAVSKYLAALDDSGLFESVELLSAERQQFQDHSLRKFSLRLRVRPIAPDGNRRTAASRPNEESFSE